jgi:Tfp pilus assembly protein PilE
MCTKLYRFWCREKNQHSQQAFTHVELMGIILVAGILPSVVTAILAHTYDFHSVPKSSRLSQRPLITCIL